MGGGADDFLAPQATQPAHSLVQEGRKLAGPRSACLRPHLAQSGGFRIESKGRKKGRGCYAPTRCMRPGSFLDRTFLYLGYLVGHKTMRLAVYGLGRFLVRGVRQAEDLARLLVEPVLEVLDPVLVLDLLVLP